MSEFINVADLKDAKDSLGRSYREINMAKKHKFSIGELIELDSGARLFVILQTRDCDGEPLYSLSYDPDDEHYMFHGFGEEGMEIVN